MGEVVCGVGDLEETSGGGLGRELMTAGVAVYGVPSAHDGAVVSCMEGEGRSDQRNESY